MLVSTVKILARPMSFFVVVAKLSDANCKVPEKKKETVKLSEAIEIWKEEGEEVCLELVVDHITCGSC